MLPGIGIFGSKNASLLVPILRENGFHIEAIWEKTLREAESVSANLQIPFFTNKIDDILLRKHVDLIFIQSSPYLRCQITVKALAIGKHVICDHPIAIHSSDATRMLRASQYYPSLITIINQPLRFLPGVIKMKRLLLDGFLGESKVESISMIEVRIISSVTNHADFNWLCEVTAGGGVLKINGGEIVDLVTFITGKRAKRVHGIQRTFVQQTDKVNGIRHLTAPDFCNFQMELEGGLLVVVTLHNHLSGSQFSQDILICGENGSYLSLRGQDLYGQSCKGSREAKEEEILYIDDKQDKLVARPNLRGLSKMVTALKEAFLPIKDGWIKEPVQSAANFEDGLYVNLVMDAIEKSSDNRAWVKVKSVIEAPNPSPMLK